METESTGKTSRLLYRTGVAVVLGINIFILISLAGVLEKSWPIKEKDLRHDQGHAYRLIFSPDTYGLFSFPDDHHKSQASRLRLFEDGKPLGPPHILHKTIRETGLGHFSHWEGLVYFSASDNTDPRINGRRYSIGHPLMVSPAIALVFAVLLAFLLIGPGRAKKWAALAWEEPLVPGIILLPVCFSGMIRPFFGFGFFVGSAMGVLCLLLLSRALVMYIRTGRKTVTARTRLTEETSIKALWFFRFAVLAAFGIHLAYLLVFPDLITFGQDSISYAHTFLHWEDQAELSFSISRMPLYPLFIFFTVKCFYLGWVPWFQHFSLLALILATAFMIRRMFPTTRGTVSAAVFMLLASLFTSQFLHGSSLMSEGLEPQAVLLVILCFRYWLEKRSPKALLLMSFVVAAGILTRPVNAFAMISVALALAMILRKKALAPVAFFIFCVLVFLMPWLTFENRPGRGPATSDYAVLPLIFSSAHLASMEKQTFVPYKAALKPSYKKYMAYRKTLAQNPENSFKLLLAGGTLGSRWIDILKRNFSLPPGRAGEIIMEILVEGMVDHPWESFSLFGKKIAAFYTDSPHAGEAWMYSHHVRRWTLDPPKQRDYADYVGFYKKYGQAPMENAPRISRFKRAGLFIRVNHYLSAIFGVLVKACLWLSIFLCPLLLVRKPHYPGIFIFLSIHIYCLVVCLMAEPMPHFFYPMVIPVFLLVMIEILHGLKFREAL